MNFPTVSREMIQSTLDVLKVLGLVKHLKPSKIGVLASTLTMQQASSTTESFYAMSEFARFPHEVDLLSIAEQVKITEMKTKNIQERIVKFKEIVDSKDMTPQSKLITVRAIIQEAKEQDNSQNIFHDPVFKIFLQE